MDYIIDDITGSVRVPSENENRKRVVNFCAKNGLYLSYTYPDMLKDVYNVKTLWEVGWGI